MGRGQPIREMGTKEAGAGSGSWHEEARGQRARGMRQESGAETGQVEGPGTTKRKGQQPGEGAHLQQSLTAPGGMRRKKRAPGEEGGLCWAEGRRSRQANAMQSCRARPLTVSPGAWWTHSSGTVSLLSCGGILGNLGHLGGRLPSLSLSSFSRTRLGSLAVSKKSLLLLIRVSVYSPLAAHGHLGSQEVKVSSSESPLVVVTSPQTQSPKDPWENSFKN